MAAATLDQVLSSLNSIYQPQIDLVQQQQAQLPAQFQAQEQGLNAQKDQAFGDILSGARSRGTGIAFGGIPLQEQAKYTATNYLPALANLKTSQNQASSTLADALNRINEARFSTGNNIYQFGVQQDFAERQFQYQQAKDAADRAEAARQAAAAAASSFAPSLGLGGSGAAAPKTNDPYAAKTLAGGKSQQDAFNAVQSLLNTGNIKTIQDTYNAIRKSASYGNTYDQYKLQVIASLPAFQKALKTASGLTFNSGGLKF